MGAFELQNKNQRASTEEVLGIEERNCDSRKIKEECIIALKVYDSCRQQDCLTVDEIGPARAAESICLGGEQMNEGDIIRPPSNAAAVTIDRLRVKKVIIVDKDPNPFRNGFWDIDLKYVFEYKLIFREADGHVIGSIRANSIFNKKITLFGSIGSDLAISTDLFRHYGESTTLDAEPFILVEAKAVELAAELRFRRHHNPCEADGFMREPNEVDVTIGLFSIIKLFRIVNLLVESKGFCVPEECEEISPINPCEFFERLDFPMDIFDPPQRPEFMAGISGNIPRSTREKDCGCS